MQIIHRNGATRKQADWIMGDMDRSGIFVDEFFGEDEDVDEINFEAALNVVFDKDRSSEDKIGAWQEFKTEQPIKEGPGSGKLIITDAMIQAKQKEMIALGLVDAEDAPVEEPEEKIEVNGLTRFGRSPLHEAIALRDLAFVKKCIKEDLYLEAVDNNGNTPREMAHYEGWTEAALLLSEAY